MPRTHAPASYMSTTSCHNDHDEPNSSIAFEWHIVHNSERSCAAPLLYQQELSPRLKRHECSHEMSRQLATQKQLKTLNNGAYHNLLIFRLLPPRDRRRIEICASYHIHKSELDIHILGGTTPTSSNKITQKGRLA
eukprot:4576001-Pyramimonas_sp.AAC.1